MFLHPAFTAPRPDARFFGLHPGKTLSNGEKEIYEAYFEPEESARSYGRISDE